MIYVEPGGSVTVTVVLGDEGLLTVGYRIVNAETAAVEVTRSTDVDETPAASGIYSATFNAPATEDVYLAVFDVDSAEPFVPVEFAVTENVPSLSPVDADLMERIAERIETDIDAEELERIAYEAQQALTFRYGPTGVPVLEEFDGRTRTLMLARPADEGETLIVRDRDGENFTSDEYQVIYGGRTIRREDGALWPREVEVLYTPRNESAARDEVTIKLVALALNYDDGVERSEIGDVTTWYRSYAEERETLIRSIAPRALGIL